MKSKKKSFKGSRKNYMRILKFITDKLLANEQSHLPRSIIIMYIHVSGYLKTFTIFSKHRNKTAPAAPKIADETIGFKVVNSTGVFNPYIFTFIM